mmetsp:Transcript_82/g.254  ORF Transcript_82/g.254 Transcript_82/m.254 type:complete len:209 (-) Transcript_82:896-1522(-)
MINVLANVPTKEIVMSTRMPTMIKAGTLYRASEVSYFMTVRSSINWGISCMPPMQIRINNMKTNETCCCNCFCPMPWYMMPSRQPSKMGTTIGTMIAERFLRVINFFRWKSIHNCLPNGAAMELSRTLEGPICAMTWTRCWWCSICETVRPCSCNFCSTSCWMAGDCRCLKAAANSSAWSLMPPGVTKSKNTSVGLENCGTGWPHSFQ